MRLEDREEYLGPEEMEIKIVIAGTKVRYESMSRSS